MIAVASDHGGVKLKDFIVKTLQARGIEVVDYGTNGPESVDYPDFGRMVALRVAKGEVERGVLICTNGIGMSILANKFPGVRAALVYDVGGARMSREHNDSNILVLGGGVVPESLAEQILQVWLETPFAGGRHQRRLEKIAQVEQELGTRIKNDP